MLFLNNGVVINHVNCFYVPQDLLSLNATDIRLYGQFDQVRVVDKLLAGKEHGFFIEAGAFDGEYLSNTLFFEVMRHWSGKE